MRINLEEWNTLPPPFHSCIVDDNVEMNKTAETEKEHSRLAEPQNVERTNQLVNMDPDPGTDLEPDINMERDIGPVTQKRQLEQQHRESKWIHREGIKRSRQNNQIISYEEIADDMDELD